MIRTGLVSITFRQRSPAQIVGLVSQGGLDGIEWGGDVHVPHGDARRAVEVRRLTVNAGLAVSAYGSYYRVGRSEAEGLTFERVLESAVALGAPVVRVWAGIQDSAAAGPEVWALITEELRRIAALAAAAHVGVATEFHGGTLCDTAASAAQLLKAVNHPALTTFWQPPNGEPAEACFAGLQQLLPQVSNAHVFHWWPTHRDRHPLEAGAERWKRYLQALHAAGRERFASIEYVRADDPDQFLRDAATLKAWCADLPAA